MLKTRQSTPRGPTAATPDEVTTTGQSGVATIERVGDPETSTSSPADTVMEKPKKFGITVTEPESGIGTTAKTHDEDADTVASSQSDIDAAATTTQDPSDVTHKRVSSAGSTT